MIPLTVDALFPIVGAVPVSVCVVCTLRANHNIWCWAFIGPVFVTVTPEADIEVYKGVSTD